MTWIGFIIDSSHTVRDEVYYPLYFLGSYTSEGNHTKRVLSLSGGNAPTYSLYNEKEEYILIIKELKRIGDVLVKIESQMGYVG